MNTFNMNGLVWVVLVASTCSADVVHVVPHTHSDTSWRYTFNEYSALYNDLLRVSQTPF
jgi:hypothetical protein